MNKRAFSLRILGITLLAAMLSGCDKLYRESMDDCYGGVSVVLRVDPATTGTAEAEAAVKEAVIYVFDSNGRFLERRPTEVNKEEMLWYPDNLELTVVGWLNKCDNYSVTQFTAGMARNDGYVRLSETRSTYDCVTPTDLFYGDVDILSLKGVKEIQREEINASRRVGAMIVTVIGLQEYLGVFDENYYITVGPTYSGLDFYGKYIDFLAVHTMDMKYSSASGDFTTSCFNVLPNGRDKMSVSVYHKEKGLVFETFADSRGEQITVAADKTENVLIDFSSSVEVSVIRSRWGEVHVWSKDIQ